MKKLLLLALLLVGCGKPKPNYVELKSPYDAVDAKFVVDTMRKEYKFDKKRIIYVLMYNDQTIEVLFTSEHKESYRDPYSIIFKDYIAYYWTLY